MLALYVIHLELDLVYCKSLTSSTSLIILKQENSCFGRLAMCGRFNIIDDPLTKLTGELLGIEFTTSANSNVCPSETIATVGQINNNLEQINANWGIKPSWAKKLLINAQAETVADKKTFKQAFANLRCVVPFSGWYEWKTQQDGRKQKYLFESPKTPLFMAGILFENGEKIGIVDQNGRVSTPPDKFQLVTLTTQANVQCLPIHHRMPLLIPPSSVKTWLMGEENDRVGLLSQSDITLSITSI